MVLKGNNICQIEDPLSEIDISDLRSSIVCPDDNTVSLINRLRLVKDIDSKRYNAQKKLLPYFVCSHFTPAIRKTINFTYADCFILDFDHFSTSDVTVDDTRSKLVNDERVLLLFKSPSEDGLKIMFRLTNKCYDSQLLSLTAKDFGIKFATKYHIETLLDRKCFDATRACFFSYDTNCYINMKATNIDFDNYINEDNMDLMMKKNADLKHDMLSSAQYESLNNEELGEHELDFIKSRLNPHALVKKNKQYYVPKELEDIMSDISIYIQDAKVDIVEVASINYGKKFKFKVGESKAEINLFYGKRGFNIVESSKAGTSRELNKLTADLMRTYFYDKGYTA